MTPYFTLQQLTEHLCFSSTDATRMWMARWGVPKEYAGRRVLVLKVSVQEAQERAKQAAKVRARRRHLVSA